LGTVPAIPLTSLWIVEHSEDAIDVGVHDDRVDAVAGAVAHFQGAMMMDVDQAAKATRDEEMSAENRGLP
jgi:hypothetical protein